MEQFEFKELTVIERFDGFFSYSVPKPFVYRVLTPTAINAHSGLVPESQYEKHKKFLIDDSGLLTYNKSKEEVTLDAGLKYHLLYLYLLCCLILIQIAGRYVLKVIYNPAPLVLDIAPPFSLVFMEMIFTGVGKIYDFPELLFLLVSLILLIKSRLVTYYVIFLLAVLNKESNLLLVFYFIAIQWKNMKRSILATHVAVQLFVGGATYGAIKYLFRFSEGSSVQYHLLGNLRFWLNPMTYLDFLKTVHPPLMIPSGNSLLVVVLLLTMITYKWHDKPPQIKRLFMLSAFSIIPVYMMFGAGNEIRALALMFPPVYLLCFHSLCSIYMGDECCDTSQQSGFMAKSSTN
jgi:hypothetical protein